MNRRRFLTTAVATAPIVAGCTGGGEEQQQQAGGSGGTRAATTVVMQGTTFRPVKTRVDAGTTVEWVNEDSVTHDVTSAQFHDVAASWDVATTLEGGESTTHTFDEAGVYEYYCTIHGRSTMCGAVLVGGATLERRLPCAGDGDGGY